MGRTTVLTLRDFIQTQQEGEVRRRSGVDPEFSKEWPAKAQEFLDVFCKEQTVRLESWEELPDSIVLGRKSRKALANLRTWYDKQLKGFAQASTQVI